MIFQALSSFSPLIDLAFSCVVRVSNTPLSSDGSSLSVAPVRAIDCSVGQLGRLENVEYR